MPTPDSEYLRVLAEARRRAATNAQLTVQRFQQSLHGTAEELLTLGEAGTFSRKRAARLRNEILEMLDGLNLQVAQAVGQAQGVTVAQVTNLHAAALQALDDAYAQGALGMARRMTGVAPASLAQLLQRQGTARTFRTLYKRHLREAVPIVDRAIERAVLTGESSRTLTNRLARVMLGHEELLGDANREIRKITVDELRELGLDPARVGGLKSLYYDAKRIGVSEVNNALRETNRLALIESPVIEAVKWVTSGRHQVRDRCDDLAEDDQHGHGPGMYPPEEWPLAPHPFCACYQGGPMKFVSPSKWAERMGEGPSPLGPDVTPPTGPSPIPTMPPPSVRGEMLRGAMFNALTAHNTKETMRRTIDAYDVPGVGGEKRPNISVHYKKTPEFAGQFSWFTDETHAAVNQAKITLQRQKDTALKELREVLENLPAGVTLENIGDWADGKLPGKSIPNMVSTGEIGQTTAVVNGLHAFRTVVHEVQHAESWFRWRRRTSDSELRHYLRVPLEEGLVEWRSREMVSRAFFGKSYRALLKRNSRTARPWKSYEPFVQTIMWVEEQFGEDLVQAVFEAGLTEARIALLGGTVRRRIQEALDRRQKDPLFDFREIVESATDEDLVELLFDPTMRDGLEVLWQTT